MKVVSGGVDVCEKKSCWGDMVVVLWLGCKVWD